MKSFSVLFSSYWSFLVFLICLTQDYFDSCSSFKSFSVLFSSSFCSQKWQFWCLARWMVVCCLLSVVCCLFGLQISPGPGWGADESWAEDSWQMTVDNWADDSWQKTVDNWADESWVWASRIMRTFTWIRKHFFLELRIFGNTTGEQCSIFFFKFFCYLDHGIIYYKSTSREVLSSHLNSDCSLTTSLLALN